MDNLKHIQRISSQACTGIRAGVRTWVTSHFGIAESDEIAAGLSRDNRRRLKRG